MSGPRFSVEQDEASGDYYVYDSLWPDRIGCVMFFNYKNDVQTIVDIMNNEWVRSNQDNRPN